MQLEINWKPGKTECSLRCRGRRSTARLERRRLGHNHSLGVKTPHPCACINVVRQYKYLGSIQHDEGTAVPDAKMKAAAALSAYAPLAFKVFGSAHIRTCVKESLFASLVLSRLLFNAHIVVPTLPYLKSLNAVYMRVVRRIANRCRFEKTQSDLQVRVMFKLLSIECVLMRAGLRY